MVKEGENRASGQFPGGIKKRKGKGKRWVTAECFPFINPSILLGPN